MIQRFGLISFIAIVLALHACVERPAPSNLPSEGIPGEVLVVAEEDALEEIKASFESLYQIKHPILLRAEDAAKKQFEKQHKFWFARSESFEGSEKTASVIVLFGEAGDYSSYLKKIHPVENFESKESNYGAQVYSNVWAKPQTVIRLRFGRDIGPDKILSKKGSQFLDSIISIFESRQGLPGNLSANEYTDSVSKLIQKSYGFQFQFPPQFRLEVSNPELVWLGQETPRFYRHLFVNIFSDSLEINSMERAIANRNAFTKKYIKNEEGTFTSVSKSDLFPLQFQTDVPVGNSRVAVLRGWYTEEGTFRRGPFVRYFFHDKENHRYIALDGFLFAPDMERLQFYRTFDLIAGTFKLNR